MTRDKKPPVSEKPVLFPIPTGWKPSGSLDHPVSCLLLDVYGTLFISGSGDIHSFAKDAARQEPLNALLHRYGISDSANALVQRLSEAVERAHVRLKDNGIDFPEIHIEALWRQLLPEMNNHCLKTFAAEFERITNPVFPMPHLGEMLQGMKQNGVLLGIISNAQFYTPRLFEEFLDASLEDLGFSEELILFSYVFGRAKPSFFLFEKAKSLLEKRNVRQENILYVGNDMLNDVFPAKAVGFQAALFAGDARSLRLRKDDARCRNLRPDLIITDLIQLLDYV